MKLYIVSGRYLRTQDEAKAHAKATGVKFDPERDSEDISLKQGDLVDFLNNLIAEMFAAGKQAGSATQAVPVAEKAPPSHSEMSVSTDEAFEALPVARQLTLAALAMENARTAFLLHEQARRAPAKPDPLPEAAEADDLV